MQFQLYENIFLVKALNHAVISVLLGSSHLPLCFGKKLIWKSGKVKNLKINNNNNSDEKQIITGKSVR